MCGGDTKQQLRRHAVRDAHLSANGVQCKHGLVGKHFHSSSSGHEGAQIRKHVAHMSVAHTACSCINIMDQAGNTACLHALLARCHPLSCHDCCVAMTQSLLTQLPAAALAVGKPQMNGLDLYAWQSPQSLQALLL